MSARWKVGYAFAWAASRFRRGMARRYWREDYYHKTCPHDEGAFVGLCVLCGAGVRSTGANNTIYHCDISWGE